MARRYSAKNFRGGWNYGGDYSGGVSGIASLERERNTEGRLRRLEAMADAAVIARNMDPDSPEMQQQLQDKLAEAGLPGFGAKPVVPSGSSMMMEGGQKPSYGLEGGQQGMTTAEGAVSPLGSPESERPQTADAMKTFHALLQRYRMANPAQYGPKTTAPGQVTKDPIFGEIISERPPGQSDFQVKLDAFNKEFPKATPEQKERIFGLKVPEGAEKTPKETKPEMTAANALKELEAIRKARYVLEKGDLVTAEIVANFPKLGRYIGQSADKVPAEVKQAYIDSMERRARYLEQFTTTEKPQGGGWRQFDH